MTWGFRVSVLALLVSAWCSSSNAGQPGNDRWFAKDKYEHFALSAFYSAGAAKIAHRHFDMSRAEAFTVGFGISISFGAGKEGADFVTKKGLPSIRDFVWDIAGAFTGALLAGLTL